MLLQYIVSYDVGNRSAFREKYLDSSTVGSDDLSEAWSIPSETFYFHDFVPPTLPGNTEVAPAAPPALLSNRFYLIYIYRYIRILMVVFFVSISALFISEKKAKLEKKNTHTHAKGGARASDLLFPAAYFFCCCCRLFRCLRDFTPTPEVVTAAVSRYTASTSPGNLASPLPTGDPVSARSRSAPSIPGDKQHDTCGDAGDRGGGGCGGGGGGGGRGRSGGGGGEGSGTGGGGGGGKGTGAAGGGGRLGKEGGEMGRVREHARAHERLREELSPAYETLFRNVVAGSDDGVRFVVDLRHVRRGRRGQGR